MEASTDRIFPGKKFISTVLELLDTKTAMTGKIAQRYIMRAAMAGIIIGIFYVTYYAIVAGFDSIPVGDTNLHIVGKFVGALVFGWALVFIYDSKSELLTSNMMITTIGVYYRKTTIRKALTLLTMCLFGNFIGGLLVALLLSFSTLLDGGTSLAMSEAVDSKLGYVTAGAAGLTDLFLRAVFCNFMINLAMLLVYNGSIDSDVLKALVMVMSVFVFAFLAFEHSVANTVLFLVHGFTNGIDAWVAMANVSVALLGNFVGGGLLIGLYYAYVNDENSYLRRHPEDRPTAEASQD